MSINQNTSYESCLLKAGFYPEQLNDVLTYMNGVQA